jgi:hypothetical protein
VARGLTMARRYETTLDAQRAAVVDTEPGRAADPVLVPIAIGELADKIAILEIKAERITDVTKVRNVRSELAQLRAVWNRRGPGSARVEVLTRELKKTNESLWTTEDEIRDCERRRDFGRQFVELARAVYLTNDRRAEIKREINLSAGSAIIEEKSYRSYQSEAVDPPAGADQTPTTGGTDLARRSVAAAEDSEPPNAGA